MSDIATLEAFATTFKEEYATEDCLMNPPGATPMPIKVMLQMMDSMKVAFPEWQHLCHGVEKGTDGTYTVYTQQVSGPMKTDLAAMGPFPAVSRDSVPDDIRDEGFNFPVEVGTYTMENGKVKICAYAGATKAFDGVAVSEKVDAIWNKKGDLSDVGFGCLFALMGVQLPPPPPPAVPTPPAAVELFFNGEAMKGKFDALIDVLADDDFELSFVGPYAPSVPAMDKEMFKGAAGNLVASFPDVTFNSQKTAIVQRADGGWAADIVVSGKHTGAAFAPKPGLAPVPTSNIQCDIGPETFAVYTDAAAEKIVKITIEPLHEGALAGPPGFYVLVGGKMPAPAPAPAPPAPAPVVASA